MKWRIIYTDNNTSKVIVTKEFESFRDAISDIRLLEMSSNSYSHINVMILDLLNVAHFSADLFFAQEAE